MTYMHFIAPQTARALDGCAVIRYQTIEVRPEPETGIIWCAMNIGDERPIVTMKLLADLKAMIAEDLPRLCHSGSPFRFFVFRSRMPGAFSLGGDLEYFAYCMRVQDRAGIRDYAHACIDVIHPIWRAFDLPLVTVALVEGDARGGGFETVLAHDLVVAESTARFGLPEVMFSLFPGMGASSFLSRKLTPVLAQRMILSNEVYQARDLQAMGLVDEVAGETEDGETCLRRMLREWGRKHGALLAVNRARRLVNPVTEREMRDVVDLWVETVLSLTERDLKVMAYLVHKQHRKQELNNLAKTSAAPAIAAE